MAKLTGNAGTTGPRVLLWDIETSLMQVEVFSLKYNDYIDPSAIVRDPYIITASWMWEGESKVHSVSVLDDPKRYAKDPHDDYHVIKTLHEVLSEADVIVHHNGDTFDKPYLDTRILVHGLSPLPPITSVDTCKVAKSKFRFPSNKLDYIGGALGVGHKLDTAKDLWRRISRDDRAPAAIREMIAYNKQDVILLRDVYLKLRSKIDNHINRELFGGIGCTRCGSTKLQSRGIQRAISRVYQRFQCQACGGWFRAVKNEKGITTKSRNI